jgi:hypothetical protein
LEARDSNVGVGSEVVVLRGCDIGVDVSASIDSVTVGIALGFTSADSVIVGMAAVSTITICVGSLTTAEPLHALSPNTTKNGIVSILKAVIVRIAFSRSPPSLQLKS